MLVPETGPCATGAAAAAAAATMFLGWGEWAGGVDLFFRAHAWIAGTFLVCASLKRENKLHLENNDV